MFLVLFWWWSVFGGLRGSSPVCAQISDQRPDWSEAAAEGAPQEGAERTQQLLSPHWLRSGYPTAARADSEPHGQPMRGTEGGWEGRPWKTPCFLRGDWLIKKVPFKKSLPANDGRGRQENASSYQSEQNSCRVKQHFIFVDVLVFNGFYTRPLNKCVFEETCEAVAWWSTVLMFR